MPSVWPARWTRKKGYNIRILHVENLTTVTDYFVIATGNSTTMWARWQTRRTSRLGRAGVNVLRTEGHDGNRWVLLDYGSVDCACIYAGSP